MFRPQSGVFFYFNMSGVIIGTKVRQSQQFTVKGDLVPVTQVSTEDCYLLNVFSKSVVGYDALQIGFGIKKKVGKSIMGQLKKAGIEKNLKLIREIRIEDFNDIEITETEGKPAVKIGDKIITIGEKISPQDIYTIGEFVSVSGTSQGKGFAGVVKRYNFRGGPKTHGQSDRHRARGSLGSGTTPGRVFKGLRMAGRMGQDRVTIKNLEVIAVSENIITIKGLVPGKVGGTLEIVPAIK